MYMGDRHLRQQTINYDNGHFSVICLHIAIRKVQTSALNFSSCMLKIFPLPYSCCKPYFSKNPMSTLLLETLFTCFNMTIFNNFNIALAPSKISGQKKTSHRIVLASPQESPKRNGAMGLLV